MTITVSGSDWGDGGDCGKGGKEGRVGIVGSFGVWGVESRLRLGSGGSEDNEGMIIFFGVIMFSLLLFSIYFNSKTCPIIYRTGFGEERGFIRCFVIFLSNFG